MRELISRLSLGPIQRLLLDRATRQGTRDDTDWAAYLAFDAALATKQTERGRQDAHARAGDIHAFFSEYPLQARHRTA